MHGGVEATTAGGNCARPSSRTARCMGSDGGGAPTDAPHAWRPKPPLRQSEHIVDHRQCAQIIVTRDALRRACAASSATRAAASASACQADAMVHVRCAWRSAAERRCNMETPRVRARSPFRILGADRRAIRLVTIPRRLARPLHAQGMQVDSSTNLFSPASARGSEESKLAPLATSEMHHGQQHQSLYDSRLGRMCLK